ncbi:MAG: hypothetical protein ACF8PG_14230, partial [Maioricimonas sp. JB045]
METFEPPVSSNGYHVLSGNPPIRTAALYWSTPMQTLLPGLLIVLTTAAAPDGAPESLEPVTAKADIVITGSFVAVPQRLKTRSGRPDVERYRADVRIHDVRKGDVDERLRRGATIPVRITRRPGDT